MLSLGLATLLTKIEQIIKKYVLKEPTNILYLMMNCRVNAITRMIYMTFLSIIIQKFHPSNLFPQESRLFCFHRRVEWIVLFPEESGVDSSVSRGEWSG